MPLTHFNYYEQEKTNKAYLKQSRKKGVKHTKERLFEKIKQNPQGKNYSNLRPSTAVATGVHIYQHSSSIGGRLQRESG